MRSAAADAPGIDDANLATIVEQRKSRGQTGHAGTDDQHIGIAYSLLRRSRNSLRGIRELSQGKGSKVVLQCSMT